MNCFFILLLYFFVRVRCDLVSGNDPSLDSQQFPEGERADILASVRQYPSLLHKCTATFIAPDTLLTTAKCLYCEDCQLFVHALSSRLTDETQHSKGESYVIKKTVIHPNYETDPQNNNVGLIQLVKNVSQAVVLGLQANIRDNSGLTMDTYRWQFTPNFREYNLEKAVEHTISNAACSSFFNQYIDYKHICTRRNKSILLGQFDQGVPIVDKTAGVSTIVGIYEAEGKTHPSTIEIYKAIFPYVDWINKILACHFSCASSITNNTSPKPTSDQTSAMPSPTTEIPSSTNTLYTVTPTVIGGGETDENQQTESENKAVNGDNKKRNVLPLRSAIFPFVDQKAARRFA